MNLFMSLLSLASPLIVVIGVLFHAYKRFKVAYALWLIAVPLGLMMQLYQRDYLDACVVLIIGAILLWMGKTERINGKDV